MYVIILREYRTHDTDTPYVFLKALLFRSNLIPAGTGLPYLAINPSLTDPTQYFMFRYGARYFIRILFSQSRHATKKKIKLIAEKQASAMRSVAG